MAYVLLLYSCMCGWQRRKLPLYQRQREGGKMGICDLGRKFCGKKAGTPQLRTSNGKQKTLAKTRERWLNCCELELFAWWPPRWLLRHHCQHFLPDRTQLFLLLLLLPPPPTPDARQTSSVLCSVSCCCVYSFGSHKMGKECCFFLSPWSCFPLGWRWSYFILRITYSWLLSLLTVCGTYEYRLYVVLILVHMNIL